MRQSKGSVVVQRLFRGVPHAILSVCLVVLIAVAPVRAVAAPYADMVIDARSGEVLHSTNADSRLHPASLTKMMTLYIAFEAVRLGEISLDTMVEISPKAASEPPSKLGLRAGQRIQLRYLIRAAAVKSANDAATAIGEAIEGSEAAFARRMNRTAQAMGMTRTTFKNAHGLTEAGHLSTARDMTVLGRHLFYDYPQYYNIFSRRTTNAGGTEVSNTNRRFLNAYEGADGIKTGYTRAAGFNLVASAERGSERVIATVFGGTSTANRNARMAELMDLGFNRAPTRVAINRPSLPRYDNLDDDNMEVVVADGSTVRVAGKIVRVSGAVSRSPRPILRVDRNGAEEPPAALLAAIETDIAAAVASVATSEAVAAVEATEAAAAIVDQAADAVAEAVAETVQETVVEQDAVEVAEATVAPRPRPAALAGAGTPAQTDAPILREAPVEVAQAETDPAETPTETLAADAAEDAASGADVAEAQSLVASAAPAPAAQNEAPAIAGVTPTEVALVSAAILPPGPEPVIRPEPEAAETVTRLSTSGGRHSGVSLGRFPSRYEAEKALITTSLSDMSVLGTALRRVVQRGGGFEANFMGMSEDQAALACRRIAARGNSCTAIGN